MNKVEFKKSILIKILIFTKLHVDAINYLTITYTFYIIIAFYLYVISVITNNITQT